MTNDKPQTLSPTSSCSSSSIYSQTAVVQRIIDCCNIVQTHDRLLQLHLLQGPSSSILSVCLICTPCMYAIHVLLHLYVYHRCIAPSTRGGHRHQTTLGPSADRTSSLTSARALSASPCHGTHSIVRDYSQNTFYRQSHGTHSIARDYICTEHILSPETTHRTHSIVRVTEHILSPETTFAGLYQRCAVVHKLSLSLSLSLTHTHTHTRRAHSMVREYLVSFCT